MGKIKLFFRILSPFIRIIFLLVTAGIYRRAAPRALILDGKSAYGGAVV